MNKILLLIYFLFFSLIAKSQSVDFTFQSNNGLFCNPASIQFTQTSPGSPTGFVWSFGNGTYSNNPNPSMIYNNAGTYTVKLIAIYEQYTLEVTKTITINPSISASINYDRNFICKPGVINFSSASSGNIAAYNWDFGDGSAIVTTTANAVSHNYLNFGIYTVTLTAIDVSGCIATTNTLISVKNIPLSGTVTPTSGCIPANVSFTATQTIPLNSSVNNYVWDFKDGSPVVTTVANNINHAYNATGNYFPTVKVTTSEGCINTYNFTAIAFGTPPVNISTYPVRTNICGSETAAFVSKATNANYYFWDFGDLRSSGVTDTITQHKFFTLGTKNIKVTPYYNGCPGTTVALQINVAGVISSFDYTNSCTDKRTFSFTNTSQGSISNLSWNFGDGTPAVTTNNPTHTFPPSGSFFTTLSVSDNLSGCNDSYSETIYTATPTLVNNDSVICKNSTTSFSILNNYNNPGATYTWNITGVQLGPFSSPNLTVSTSLLGNFSNNVVINNGANYCLDTVKLNKTLLVRGPVINFTAPVSICLNNLYTVINSSYPFLPSDSVKLWYWNFGEINANDSIYQPLPYKYSNVGVLNVKLSGIDKNGCKDSLVKTVRVLEVPFLRVVPGIDTLCSGAFDTLIAFHTDSISWSPGNVISCTTCDSIMANPTVTTNFFATATNVLNCSSKDSVLVKVFSPFTAIALPADVYLCLNDITQLNIDPPMKKITWLPATGLSNTSNYTPLASPKQTTTYTARLVDSAGCFTSSADIIVHVKSLPTVNAGPDKSYAYNSNYTFTPLYSNNVNAYLWTPSSQLTCSNCALPNGIARVTTKYLVTVTSDSGCIAKDTITIFVDCRDADILMPTAFTPNGDDINDKFYPLTRGVRSILRFSIYNREGQLVYEAKNFQPNNKAFGWNGKINKADQSSNVFVYYVEALCDVGEKLFRRGSVVLIR